MKRTLRWKKFVLLLVTVHLVVAALGQQVPMPDTSGERLSSITEQQLVLDKLVPVLKQYLNDSAAVNYLLQPSIFSTTSPDHAGRRVSVFQLKGTPANGNRDLIVAINFDSATLKVSQPLNSETGILPGTQFTDVSGHAAYPYTLVNQSNQVYIELPANSYAVWVQGAVTTQPLRLLNFLAQAVTNVVQLKWAVAQNEAVKSFDIERADDGVNFVKVGSRIGLNQSGTVSYDFVDATPKKNTGLLYRLKVIGRDGTELYSDLMLARIDDGELAVRLRQNPVRENLELEIKATENGKASVSVVSSGGQQVLTQAIRLSAGANPVSLPAGFLPQGIYQLVVEAGRKSKIISFVKE